MLQLLNVPEEYELQFVASTQTETGYALIAAYNPEAETEEYPELYFV